MNVIDSLVEIVMPTQALKRMGARNHLEMIHRIKNSGYSEGGASTKKHYGRGWIASSKSPQEDIDKNLPTLRARSRNLVMTAPLAVSAIRTNRTNVVGSGLRPKPKIDGELLRLTDDEVKRWEKRTEKEFNVWAESKHCDVRKLNNFYENQQLVLFNQLMNGDACCLFSYADKEDEKFMPYNLRLNIIESDRICSPNSNGSSVNLFCKNEKNGNKIYNGVEIDKKGAVQAYYICSTYPNSNNNIKKEWIRVEAFGKNTGLENILMIFDSERAEQYRGVPYLAPVIESIKQLTRYTEAELMSAVISSFFTAFIKTEDEYETEELFDGGVDPGESVKKREHEYEMGPGAINLLNPGESVDFGDPKHPSSNFELFVLSMAKYTGAALEIPVELLTKHFAASYSASRAAILEAWKMFRMRRTWLVNDFCQPVYERFLTEAVASGKIMAPGFFYNPVIRKAWSGCQWNGPAPGMIDPVKEVEAAEKKIALGISTREKEAMELNGMDFSENVRQLGKEQEEMNMYLLNETGGNADDQILGF